MDASEDAQRGSAASEDALASRAGRTLDMCPARPSLPAITPEVVDNALELYGLGAFPMGKTLDELEIDKADWLEGYVDALGPEVEWYAPKRRALIPLDERFHVPASLGRRVRSGRFTITSDRAFSRVVRACAMPKPGREHTWLHPWIIGLLEAFHAIGRAHSVEAWRRSDSGEEVLVGGLYGVTLGRVFAGESMFSWPHLGGTDASKCCLVRLVDHLRMRGFAVLDSQMRNPHLTQFGLVTVSAEAYTRLLDEHARTRDGELSAPTLPWDWPI